MLGDSLSTNQQPVQVLVVDDYPENAASMAMLLKLYGHEVETTLSGREALQKAQARPPDIVFLDISMPGMDGYQVARQFRRLLHDRVKLIALTALGSEADHQRCLNAGFDLHLVKPADPQEVQGLVEQARKPSARSWRDLKIRTENVLRRAHVLAEDTRAARVQFEHLRAKYLARQEKRPVRNHSPTESSWLLAFRLCG